MTLRKIVATVTLTAALAACGSSTETSPTNPPSTTDPAATPVAEQPITVPPGDGDDAPGIPEEIAQIALPMPLAEFTERAEEVGYIVRVVREDGQDMIVTMDYRINRINVEVTDGQVTAIMNIG